MLIFVFVSASRVASIDFLAHRQVRNLRSEGIAEGMACVPSPRTLFVIAAEDGSCTFNVVEALKSQLRLYLIETKLKHECPL